MKSHALCCTLLLLCSCAHESRVAPTPAVVPVSAKPEAIQAPPRVNHWNTEWTPLIVDDSLTNWAVTDFAGHGGITASNEQINIGMGAELSGITWTNGTLPGTDYEISLDAMKVDGGDFFCGLTFPVTNSSCSLIIGGWGGGVVGLSSIDDNDASENETSRTMEFATGRWYHVLLRVTPKKIQAWLDQDKIIDISIVDRKVSLRPGSIYLSAPLGIATYETSGAIRDFKLRLIEH